MPQQEKYPVLQQRKLLDYAAVSHPVLLFVPVYVAMLRSILLLVPVCAEILHPILPLVPMHAVLLCSVLPEKQLSVQLQELPCNQTLSPFFAVQVRMTAYSRWAWPVIHSA